MVGVHVVNVNLILYASQIFANLVYNMYLWSGLPDYIYVVQLNNLIKITKLHMYNINEYNIKVLLINSCEYYDKMTFTAVGYLHVHNILIVIQVGIIQHIVYTI